MQNIQKQALPHSVTVGPLISVLSCSLDQGLLLVSLISKQRIVPVILGYKHGGPEPENNYTTEEQLSCLCWAPQELNSAVESSTD